MNNKFDESFIRIWLYLLFILTFLGAVALWVLLVWAAVALIGRL